MSTQIYVGDTVLCDLCNEDYTSSKESGGFLFGTYAYCPKCAIKGLENIKKYNEEKYIKSWCPPDMSFADWVRNIIRNGQPGMITITYG